MTVRASERFRTTRFVIAAIAASVVGCTPAKEMPPTYAATGKVVRADGTAVTGGAVEFRQAEPPYVSATAPIGPDGSFELSSIVDETKLSGMPVGSYRVTVLPNFSDAAEMQHLSAPAIIKTPVTVKADAENRYTIDLGDAEP